MASPIKTTNYRSFFDKAFVEIVVHLIKNRDTIEGITNRKELLEDLGINPGNYTELKSGKRGVPNDKIAYAKKRLIDKYKVNPDYIKSRTLPIMAKDINAVNEPSEAYVKANASIETLKQQLAEKEALLNEKDIIIRLQQDSIETLKDMVQLLKQNVGEN